MAECKDIEVYIAPDLEKRLEEEQDMLERYFNRPGQYPLLNRNDEPCFEHEVILNGDRIYKLRVYVNSEYPNQLPDLVVCESPEQMPSWGEEGGSHSTHTWPPKYGFLHICHWHWAAWTKEYMIFQVFNKGEEWLEAYEKYLVTKKLPLDLQDMKLTEEEKARVQSQFVEQVALEMRINPAFANELLRWHMRAIIIGEILAQRKLPIQAAVSINEDPHGLFKLQCAIIIYRLVNPGREIHVSYTQTDDGRLHFSLIPTLYPSLQNY